LQGRNLMNSRQKRNSLTHLDQKGRLKMVDIGEKPVSKREAIAEGAVYMNPNTLCLIEKEGLPKGDVLSVARVAGILGAKKVPELIPLCHNIIISSVDIDIRLDKKKSCAIIRARVSSEGKTGVEMEALTAVVSSALTIYDMCKAVDKEMVIGDIVLVEKKGGRSGHYKRVP